MEESYRVKVREQESVIRFGTDNIWNRMNGGLELALQGMYQRKIDPGSSKRPRS